MLVLGVVAGMVSLGFWQLRRLDERRDRNALIEARATEAPVPVGRVVDAGDGVEVTDPLRFRAVTAAGAYAEPTVSVRTTQNGAPGGYVLTPLALDGGEVVVVLRGFAGIPPDGGVAEPAPPSGEVAVEGLAIPLDRLPGPTRRGAEEAGGGGALPVVVQLTASEPADDATLTPVPVPDLDDGPHLNYAVQWFLFAAVTAGGYPFLLRRRARGG